MTLRSGIRWVVLALMSLIYAVIGLFAAGGAIGQWERAVTMGQRIETIAQLTVGIFTLGPMISPLLEPAWGHRIRVAWGLGIASVAGMSGLVWGPPMILVAACFVFVAAGIALGLDRASTRLRPQ